MEPPLPYDDDLRRRMTNTSREGGVDVVMSTIDSVLAAPSIAFHTGQADDFAAMAERILKDIRNHRRPTRLSNVAMLQESANYHLRQAVDLLRSDVEVLKGAYRLLLDRQTRDATAAAYYQRHAHSLEVALHQHADIDVSDIVGEA